MSKTSKLMIETPDGNYSEKQSEIEQIYTSIIMEHSTNSQNKHELAGETCSLHGHNPNCGDDITLHIIFDGDKIADLSFTGSGCAIYRSYPGYG